MISGFYISEGEKAMRKIIDHLEKTEGKAIVNRLKKHFVISADDFKEKKNKFSLYGRFGGGNSMLRRGGLGDDFFNMGMDDEDKDEVPKWKTNLIKELKESV